MVFRIAGRAAPDRGRAWLSLCRHFLPPLGVQPSHSAVPVRRVSIRLREFLPEISVLAGTACDANCGIGLADRRARAQAESRPGFGAHLHGMYQNG